MRVCSEDGCGKPHRARGLCSTHYNQRHVKNRHPEKVRVKCGNCGATCMKAPDPRRPVRFCSYKCRDDFVHAESRERARNRVALVHVGPSWPRCDLPTTHPARRPAPKPDNGGRWWTVMVAGDCQWCGAYFVDAAASYDTRSLYCSRRCQRVANKAKRGRFVVPDTLRVRVYERDGWTCQICGDPTSREYNHHDPKSPTLDHVVPQSWFEDSPDHSEDNLRLVHAICNSYRNNEQDPEWEEKLLTRLAD